MANYNKSLKLAMSQSALERCAATDAELEHAIAEISTALKGSLSNDMRLLLVADRAELRATLAKRQARA